MLIKVLWMLGKLLYNFVYIYNKLIRQHNYTLYTLYKYIQNRCMDLIIYIYGDVTAL
jgi:hypothetical protein